MTFNYNQLPAIKDQIKKCVRCGQCRMVCPVFAEIRNETVSPRGHVFMVQMLRDGKVQPSEDVYQHLGQCLLCETCTLNCPAGIKIHEMNAASRSFIEQKNPHKRKNLVFDNMWSHPSRLKFTVSSIRRAQSTGLQSLADKLGIIKLMDKDLAKAQKILNNIPKRSALDQLRDYYPAIGEKKYTVGYFVGCATNLLYPEIALAMVNVLIHNGCDVVIPHDVNCCGMPHIANGKIDLAETLAQHNIAIFENTKADYIVTDCASCSAALKKSTLQLLIANETWADRVSAFSAKAMDLTSFLQDIVQLKEIPSEKITGITKKVTYHDPCHLVNAQKITQQPRALLKLNPDVELVEMKNANRCCGGSGTYSMTHYELSMKILKRKVDAIKATGAEIVATCCPSCSMQLRYGLDNNGLQKVKVVHVVEMINQLYPNAL